MKREMQITKDGSHTISIPEMNAAYHSIHGALQESLHVFIEAGFKYFLQNNSGKQTVSIFEMGFGTGLNALLTLIEANNFQLKIFYKSIELYPLQKGEYEKLNYAELIKSKNLQNYFLKLHECDWENDIDVNENFLLHKTNQSLLRFFSEKKFDIIYYDAFAPSVQPELWTTEVFEKLFSLLNANGILITYCSKGDVRRSLLAAGFSVEKLKGPKGKREILSAKKA